MTEGKEGLDAKVRKGKDKRIVGCYKHKAEKATKQELHSKVLQIANSHSGMEWFNLGICEAGWETVNETKVGWSWTHYMNRLVSLLKDVVSL